MRAPSLKILIVLLSLCNAISPVIADEGMWIPMLLKQGRYAIQRTKAFGRRYLFCK